MMGPLSMEIDWAIRRLQEVSRKLVTMNKSHRDKFADKVLPGAENLSKPTKPGDEVGHYMRKYKNKTPLKSTGKPIKSRDQALAIGLSEAKKGQIGLTANKSGALPYPQSLEAKLKKQ
jgi:hypothetical protein